jgi:O-succinylbenzoate synthase
VSGYSGIGIPPLVNAPSAYLYKLPMAGGGIREGILLRLGDRWGDAAPLQGWSRETLDDVRSCLDRCEDFVPASLRCALEALDVDRAPLRSEVPLNALLDGDEARILAGALRAFRHGCRCLKIKTSGVEVARLPDLLSDITRETGQLCQLRIDPNRTWTFDETLRLADKLSHFPIEYLEEPLAGSSRLQELISRSACPIALDETLREITPAELSQFQGAAALVLKPTLMGGFECCRKFAEEGEKLDMVSVVSAAYESGVGIHSLGRFAASLPMISSAGLDTYSRLAADVLVARLDWTGFVFRADQPLPAIDESRLFLL